MRTRTCVADIVGGARCPCDRHQAGVTPLRDYFDRAPIVPSGPLFTSSWFKLLLEDQPSGSFGWMDLDTRPFELHMNRNVAAPRLKASALHEMLHASDELFKLNLSHEQLHSLAVFLSAEIVPAYLALQRALGE